MVKKELSLITRPRLFSLTVILFSLGCALRFYLFTGFFLIGRGSVDLRPFFSFMPYLAVMVIPVFVMPLWGRSPANLDALLPVNEVSLGAAKILAAFTAFVITLLPTLAVPLSLCLFGNPDWGAVLSGYGGILAFAFNAAALGTFFSLLSLNRVGAFLCTASLLLFGLLLGSIPRLAPLPAFASRIVNGLSTSWRLDAAYKGIIDTRDLVFYFATGLLWLVAGSFVLKQRRGENAGAKTLSSRIFSPTLAVVINLILLILISTQFPLRIDLSRDRAFSLSPYTLSLLDSLDGDLTVTYFVSPEVEILYPEAKNINDLLASFAAASKGRVTVITRNPAASEGMDAALTRMGISGRQVELPRRGRTEEVTIYSALTVEYGGAQQIVPFILLPETLEYELDRRVLTVMRRRAPTVFMMSGNGLEMTENYTAVQTWVQAAGFDPVVIQAQDLADPEAEQFFDPAMQKNSALLVFGSNDLGREQARAIETYVEAGGAGLFAVSPVTVDIGGEWSARLTERDRLLPVLDTWGFSFAPELVQDISCYDLAMRDAQDTRSKRNYPLWVKSANTYVFWGSPLTLWEDAQPLLTTTAAGWVQEALDDGSFVTHPLTVPLVPPTNSKVGVFTLAASYEGPLHGYYNTDSPNTSRVVVIGDQYFAADLLLESSVPWGNLDFLVDSLLFLVGDEELLGVKQKGARTTTLHATEELLATTALPTMFFTGLLAPLALTLLWRRRKKVTFQGQTVTITGKIQKPVRAANTAKRKKTWHLRLVSILLIAVFVLGVLLNHRNKPRMVTLELVPGAQDVEKVLLQDEEGILYLVKQGGHWLLDTGEILAPVEKKRMTELLSLVRAKQKYRVLRHSTGFAPTFIMDFGHAAGNTSRISFGAPDITGEGISFSLGGGVYQGGANFAPFLTRVPERWADLRLVPQFAGLTRPADIQGYRVQGKSTPVPPNLLDLQGSRVIPAAEVRGNGVTVHIEGGNGASVILDVLPLNDDSDFDSDPGEFAVVPRVIPGPAASPEEKKALSRLNYAILVSPLTAERLESRK